MTREEAIRTFVVKYAGYEDIGRVILTNGDIFCKIFYEDARQNDDSDYDSLVPDEYKTDPSDLISRADAICEVLVNDGIDNIVDRINDLPSAELPKGDLISRADVLKYPIRLDHYDEVNGSREFVYGVESVIEYVESLPSADAESDDLIIKGAKGIHDGLYNIKDGKLFMHKANGGTVRTYPIVPSANAVQGWIPCSERLPKESGDYLCTIPLDADETYVEVLTFHKGRFYEDDDEWGATYHDDVLAWMPLPKSYECGATMENK